MISVFSAIINVLKNGMYAREYKESTSNRNERPFVELSLTASTVPMMFLKIFSYRAFITNVSQRFFKFTVGVMIKKGKRT